MQRSARLVILDLKFPATTLQSSPNALQVVVGFSAASHSGIRDASLDAF